MFAFVHKLLVNVLLNAVVFKSDAEVNESIVSNEGKVELILLTEVIVEYDDNLLVNVLLNAVVFNNDDEVKSLIPNTDDEVKESIVKKLSKVLETSIFPT